MSTNRNISYELNQLDASLYLLETAALVTAIVEEGLVKEAIYQLDYDTQPEEDYSLRIINVTLRDLEAVSQFLKDVYTTHTSQLHRVIGSIYPTLSDKDAQTLIDSVRGEVPDKALADCRDICVDTQEDEWIEEYARDCFQLPIKYFIKNGKLGENEIRFSQSFAEQCVDQFKRETNISRETIGFLIRHANLTPMQSLDLLRQTHNS